MVNEIKYTSIRRVLDNLKDDPELKSLTLEQAVRHTIRFMEKNGYPQLYSDKQNDVEIHEFRGVLPYGLISIRQVKDCKTGLCLRAMTDTFLPPGSEELSFKTQGRVIYTSFPEGMVSIAYKAVETDDDGFPLLIDNEVYLDALEAYITLRVYTTKFRNGKLSANILQEIQQSYATAVRLLETEMTTPSTAEMESMTRYMNSLIPRVREFDNGFSNLGDRQFIKRQ